jgi:hypothetical protein
MRFTPFHSGTGLAAKIVAPRYFSLSVFFVFTPVIVDITPLYCFVVWEKALVEQWKCFLCLFLFIPKRVNQLFGCSDFLKDIFADFRF